MDDPLYWLQADDSLPDGLAPSFSRVEAVQQLLRKKRKERPIRNKIIGSA